MQLSNIEVPYNGQSFFIDIAEGKMVSLNRIYEISDSPKNQDPRQWTRLPSTKILIESMNVEKSHILKTKRGEGGGTWAHWQIALSYAHYLSPELHLAVNQVFKERLEENIDPELGISRSRERALKNWKNQGHDEKWIADRDHHAETRKTYVKTLIEHDVKPNHEIGVCTNKIYKGLFGKNKSEIEKDIREKKPSLPKKINIRDHAKRSSIAAIGLAEALASEEIEESDVRGVSDCSQVSFDKGQSVRLALDDSRSKSTKKSTSEPVDEEKKEKYKERIKDLRDSINKKD
ncbi:MULTISPECIES: KilA-N domain-containing protein [Methylobacter]